PEFGSSYDFVPTVCDAIGVEAPNRNLCGRSYLPLATGKLLPKKQPWRTTVFGSLGNTGMAREERYKLVERSEGAGELYEMIADRGEHQNQYENPQFLTVRTELGGKLGDWRKRYSA